MVTLKDLDKFKRIKGKFRGLEFEVSINKSLNRMGYIFPTIVIDYKVENRIFPTSPEFETGIELELDIDEGDIYLVSMNLCYLDNRLIELANDFNKMYLKHKSDYAKGLEDVEISWNILKTLIIKEE